MRKRLLQYLRNYIRLSQDDLYELCHVDAHYICNAEKHGDHLGTGQLERLAKALGWKGDPALLLKFTDELPGFEALVDWERVNEMREAQRVKKEAARRRGPRARKAQARCAGCPAAIAMADGAEAAL